MPWTLRLAPIALACALVPALASVAVAAPARPVSVIGGKNASLGEWPDVAAILYPDDPSDPTLDVTLCTGTLIAPTVVLTAGHCYDPNNPPLPDNVLIGAATLARPEQGEVIAIKQGFVYPDAETSFDLAVLVLASVTSRGYDDSPLPCSAGGIYVRPDKVLDWIETTAGVPVSRASELSEGGCCDAGGSSGGAIPLAIGVVALARRRRRARS
jgi:hypothetical protein